jgi:uncharacterized protein Veg
VYSPNVMSKVAYQPFTVLMRAEPTDSGWISTSAKVLRAASTFATMISLFGAVAICSIGFSAFKPGTFGPKESTGVAVFPTIKVPATPSPDQDHGIDTSLRDTNQGHQGTTASAHSIIDQTSATALHPTPPTTSVAPPEASVNVSALVEPVPPEAVRTSLERELPKVVRKKLEKGRREAERKRSRLEEMYQNHAISSEAYKRGEEKYKSAIERYRRAVNAGTGPKNASEF